MQKQPMILVVGEPGTGKSVVARAMADLLRWPVRHDLGFHDSGFIYDANLSRKQIDLLKECEDVLAVYHVVRDVATTMLGRLPEGEHWLPNNRSLKRLVSLSRWKVITLLKEEG